jgi:hypothetical protein
MLKDDKPRFRDLCSRATKNPRIARSGIPRSSVNIPFDLLARRCLDANIYVEQFQIQKPGIGFDDVEVKLSLGDAFGGNVRRPETYRYALAVRFLPQGIPKRGERTMVLTCPIS